MSDDLLEHALDCPYCWAPITMLLDPTEGPQEYVEDCEVCCHPIAVRAEFVDGELISFEAEQTP